MHPAPPAPVMPRCLPPAPVMPRCPPALGAPSVTPARVHSGSGTQPGPSSRGTLTEPTTPGLGMRHSLCRCLYFPKQEEGSNPDPVEKPTCPQKQADPQAFGRTDTVN